jgi:hypothetical protein
MALSHENFKGGFIMATAQEVFQALNEKAGFQADNENWTKDTFTWKDIAPGKVWIYFQTGTGEECATPNFGFHREDGLTRDDFENIRVELGNIIGKNVEDDGAFIFTYVKDLEDRSVDWALKAIQELERRILFELSK